MANLTPPDPPEKLEYTFTPLIYTIPIFHAAGHPSSTTLGVFLGHTLAHSTPITQAIPLIHHYASLSFVTELALDHVEVYAKEKGVQIVGLWVAPERGEALGRSGERVLRALKDRWDGAFALVVRQVLSNKMLG